MRTSNFNPPKLFNFTTKSPTKIAICSSCISYYHCVPLLAPKPPISRYLHTKQLNIAFEAKTNQSLKASKDFMFGKSIVNDTIWYMTHIERNLGREWKDNYIKTLQVWKEIEWSSKEIGDIPIFFTGTVKGELHPFTAHGKYKQIRKEDWNKDKLKEAYQELQHLHQDIRKQANRSLGYSPKFIRAIEYHKTYVPHSHIVYFVKPNDVAHFLKIIDNKVNLNIHIGKVETKVLDAYDISKNYSPISYLLKYLKKKILEITDENCNERDLKIFNGWKLSLGIKQLYNNSQFKIPKWAIKKLSSNFSNYEEMGFRSMLEAIENTCHIENEAIQIDGTIKTKIINTCDNPLFSIYRKIERYPYSKLISIDPIREYEDGIADRILEYKVWNKEGDLIFDKSQWELLEDIELLKYHELTLSEQQKQIRRKSQLNLFDLNIVFEIMFEENGIEKKSPLRKYHYDYFPIGCIQ